MQIMTTVKLMAVFMLAASVTAYAQGTNSAAGGDAAPGGHQHQSPEQMSKHLIEKFDANKDGELSVDELTKAVESMKEHQKKGPDGGDQTTAKGGSDADHPTPDKVAAQMIEKFSSDKKGLKQVELQKALEERRAKHVQHGKGGPQDGAPAAAPNAGSN